MGGSVEQQTVAVRGAVVEPPLDTAPRVSLGEVLCARGVVSGAAMGDALARKGNERLGDYLVRTAVLSEDLVGWAVAQQNGLPYIDLTHDAPQPDAAALIAADAAHAFQILPLRIHPSGTLDVVVGDPTDALVHRVLSSLPVRRVRIGMAPPSQLRASIDHTFPGGSAPAAVDGDRRIRMAFERLLRQAVAERATDIHFEPDHDDLRVRFRVDGVLRRSHNLLSDVARPLLAYVKHIAGAMSAEVHRPQQGHFGCTINGQPFAVRISTVPTVGGEHCVVQLRPRDAHRL